jgi:hypothetical protein
MLGVCIYRVRRDHLSLEMIACLHHKQSWHAASTARRCAPSVPQIRGYGCSEAITVNERAKFDRVIRSRVGVRFHAPNFIYHAGFN